MIGERWRGVATIQTVGMPTRKSGGFHHFMNEQSRQILGFF